MENLLHTGKFRITPKVTKKPLGSYSPRGNDELLYRAPCAAYLAASLIIAEFRDERLAHDHVKKDVNLLHHGRGRSSANIPPHNSIFREYCVEGNSFVSSRLRLNAEIEGSILPLIA